MFRRLFMKIYFNSYLAEKLCDRASGSGLDTKPHYAISSKSVIVLWDYHLLNQHGYYDGYWAFTLKIPKASPMDFVIRGKRGNPRKESAYGVKDYLYDLFNELVSEVIDEAGIGFNLVSEKIYPGDKDYNPNIPFAKTNGYHYGRAHYEYSGTLQED
jgi:hypothetical protein